MFCGVASIITLPSRAHLAWSPQTALPGSLGGSPSPERITGHLCAPCRSACDGVGSIGATAMERALLTHHLAPLRTVNASQLVGLKAWSVARGAIPSVTPWAHIEYPGGLDEYP